MEKLGFSYGGGASYSALAPKSGNNMRQEGIQTSIHYPPIHKFSYYLQKNPNVYLPQTEVVAAREVTLPLYPSMDEEKVHWVVSAIKESLHQSMC